MHAGRLRRVEAFVREAKHFHSIVSTFFATQLLVVRT